MVMGLILGFQFFVFYLDQNKKDKPFNCGGTSF